MEKENANLTEHLEQVKESLEINKQIQNTILSSKFENSERSQDSKAFKDVDLNQCNCLQDLKVTLISKNEELDSQLQESRRLQRTTEDKVLVLEQVNKNIIE